MEYFGPGFDFVANLTALALYKRKLAAKRKKKLKKKVKKNV